MVSGHLFHAVCLERHIEQWEKDHGHDYDSDDEYEDMTPDCPSCRTPITNSPPKVTMDRISPSLLQRIYPAICKVYLSPPTADEAERMREVDQLWSKVERMHHELEECTNKAAAANTKCKKAESKATGLTKRVKELMDALQKEQQRYKFLQSALASSMEQRKKAETSSSPVSVPSEAPACNKSATNRDAAEETRQRFAVQMEQMAQAQVESTPASSSLGRIPTSSPCPPAYPNQTRQASPRFTPYSRPQAYRIPPPATQLPATTYLSVQVGLVDVSPLILTGPISQQAGPSNYTPSSGATTHQHTPEQQRTIPMYPYYPAFQVPPQPQRQQTAAAIGNAQMAGFQSAPAPAPPAVAPSTYALPAGYSFQRPVWGSESSSVPPMTPSYPYQTPQMHFGYPSNTRRTDETQQAASTQSSTETESYAQEQSQPQPQSHSQSQPHSQTQPPQQQQHVVDPASQVRPYGTTMDANGRTAYVYVTGDGRFIYSDRMM
ncbi:hypothetical protein BC629DRAFT_1590901 [Irpex lacteus]|nr:hypothetical protein BC629DRAFT_1590901 [Irpex lacteus]